METKFTFGAVLDILFTYTTAGASALADFYIERDRTLVYKWRHDKAFPSRPLFPGIIRFVMDKSSEATRPVIREKINGCIESSALTPAQKQELISEKVFPDYLLNVINALAVLWKLDKSGGDDENESDAAERLSVSALIAETDGKDASPETISASAEDAASLPASGDPRQTKLTVHINFSHSAIFNIFLAFAACLLGDGLWAALAWALRWSSDVWTRGGGGPSFIWGLLFALPIIVLAMLPPRGEGSRGTKRRDMILFAGSFSAAGGAAGFLLAKARLGELITQWVAVLVAKEIVLVFISALVMTFLPTLVLLALLRFPKIQSPIFFLMELGPALLCVLFALPAVFAGAWHGGAFWLGGYIAGAAARLGMYLSVRHILKRYPAAYT